MALRLEVMSLEKTVRIVIQTKGGFKFGYEKTVRKDEVKKIEPLKLKQIKQNNKKKEVDIYV